MAVQDCFVSSASFWEIAIKVSLKRLHLPDTMDRYVTAQMSANGFDQLPINLSHIARCASLAWHHRDPFDRLLICQAHEEGLSIVSRDRVLDAYGVQRIW